MRLWNTERSRFSSPLYPKRCRPRCEPVEKPLGALLGEYAVEHYGRPAAYFSVPADERIARSLHQRPGEILYGRCNQLLDRDGIVFADIVEILPRSNESEKWVRHVSNS